MQKGIIKRFNTRNGLGVIIDAEGNKVHLHFSVIKDGAFKSLKEGDEVEFEAREGRHGLEATVVTRLTS